MRACMLKLHQRPDGSKKSLIRRFYMTKDANIKREMLWDTDIADSISGITLRKHEPVRKGAVLESDEPWEGEHCCYGKIIYDGEKYRFYYRGCGFNDGVWNKESGEHAVWCVAYSFDGKHFFKPDLGIYEYRGSTHNNIVMMDGYIDNFSILLDTNPNCPPEERYKAISGYTYDWDKKDISLKLYKSADGLHFEYVGEILRGLGYFDSMNTIFWEEDKGRYCIYMRDYHDADPDYRLEYDKEKHVRDICVTYSEDFVNWTAPKPLSYGEDDRTEFQLYTNGIMRYYRGDIYVGLPTRYIDRTPDEVNYKYLPDINGYRDTIIKLAGRCGTAMTDCMVMTSRNGYDFKRLGTFFTPGPENGDNWAYGDCYFAHGIIETASDFKGEANEMSLYLAKGYRARPVTWERYTLRLDGFFSWRAEFEGGRAVTKPMVIDGDSLSVNFATSAVGYLRIELLDENGKAIEGYCSGRLFGDSVDRPVDFEKPLSELHGKNVRMRITMRDCDFYSFTFA